MRADSQGTNLSEGGSPSVGAEAFDGSGDGSNPATAEGCAACERDDVCAPTATCTDSTLIVCGEQGTITEQVYCPLRCSTSQARCNDLAASNGLSEFLDAARVAPPLFVSAGSTIDTDLGVIIDPAGVPFVPEGVLIGAPAGGIDVRVFFARSATFEDVLVTGSAALALISAGDVLITGRVDLSGTLATNGPGAMDTDDSCEGKAGSGNAAEGLSSSGAGGGGFGTAGAKGGDTGVLFVGGDGGASVGNETLTPLRGGCRGGGAGAQANGGAGGALQISSGTRIAIASNASIDVAGAGGYRDLVTGSGGAGGGSGGAVLLEAPSVEIAPLGGITANGGGGGCFNEPGGADGALSLDPALGGLGSSGKGAGGLGGARNQAAPTPGEDVPFEGGNSNAAGGGGGGVGRIRINTLTGVFASMPAAIVSPEPSIGVLALQ